MPSIFNQFKPPVKLHWWRDINNPHENFGDEITQQLIKSIFKRRVEWTPASECSIIGAGSIIDEVTEIKGSNRPYLWSSGFIKAGDMTVSNDDYKILAVRGRRTLERISGSRENIVLGDAGLLASYLLPEPPKKKYMLGILPHYVDKNHELVEQLANEGGESVRVIDAFWPSKKVVKEIAQCEYIITSSMHGLIVSDSLGIPNIRVKLSDKLTGGDYKFGDYYSIFTNDRYTVETPQAFMQASVTDVAKTVEQRFIPVADTEMNDIKQQLIDVFPF